MTQFEFAFALFGLLLGLSLAEVLGGLARTIEARLRPGSAIRVGWLVPLLAVFVILDLLSFWRAAWLVRDAVTVSGPALLAITAFASTYYLASALVFPRDLASTPDFNEHFFRVRRIVIGTLLVLLLWQVGYNLASAQLAAAFLRPVSLLFTSVLVLLMIAATVVRGERPARVVMLLLIGRYLILYVISLR